MERFNLFVVFHQKLDREYYNESLLPKYTFVNVNPGNTLVSDYSDYTIINQYEFRAFHPLGKWYTESEVIYNIYKNNYLYENDDYVGFLQYDIDSTVLTADKIKELISGFDHVNFQPYLFDVDYDQKILMDISQPEKKTGMGVNCYDEILKDYNAYYGTKYSIEDLRGKTINLCSSFIVRKGIFNEMMEFICPLIESGKLNIFDKSRQFRMQGGYLERYYAVWLSLRQLHTSVIKLDHHFVQSIAQDSLLNRILRKLRLK